MLTVFGKKTRNIRMDNNELLKDMADKLGVTSAYLSAVETGKRRVPAKWVESISEKYGLSGEQKKELQEACDQSVLEVKIELRNMEQRKTQAAVSFAKQLENLSDYELENIMKILEKPKRRKKNAR